MHDYTAIIQIIMQKQLDDLKIWLPPSFLPVTRGYPGGTRCRRAAHIEMGSGAKQMVRKPGYKDDIF